MNDSLFAAGQPVTCQRTAKGTLALYVRVLSHDRPWPAPNEATGSDASPLISVDGGLPKCCLLKVVPRQRVKGAVHIGRRLWVSGVGGR